MDQKTFERLTRACDTVLDRFSDDPAVVGISWLHVLNVHPNTIQHYQYGLRKRSSMSWFRQVLYHIGYVLYKLTASIFEYRASVNDFPGKTDILFISHLVNKKLAGDDTDFYYGDLISHSQTQKGLSVAVGMLDHTKGTKTRTWLSLLKPNQYLFPKTVTFAEELSLIRKCFNSFRKLLAMSRKEADADVKNILKEAALQAISPDTFYTLRIYASINQLIQQVRPTNMVITWEGRAWERLAIYAANNAGFSVKCIGYQHTILLSSAHGIKRSLGNAYDPAMILTLGGITCRILSTGSTFTSTTLKSYGSYRQVFGDNKKIEWRKKITCLVTPEGLESESLILFGFAVEAAKKIPEMDFIFRMHPVFPYSVFSKKHLSFLSLPSNCKVSDRLSMNEDLKRSDFLLYRASSVAIYAVINGLKPVYCNCDNEMPIDSLYLMNNWRAVVSNSDEFKRVVTDHLTMTDEEKEQVYQPALAFCHQYVTPPREAVFFDNLAQAN